MIETINTTLCRVGKQLEQNLGYFEKISEQYSKINEESDSQHEKNVAQADETVQQLDDGNPFGSDRKDSDVEKDKEREAKDAQKTVGFVRQIDESFLNLFLRFSDAYQDLFVHRKQTLLEEKTAAIENLTEFALSLFRRYLILLRSHLLVLAIFLSLAFFFLPYPCAFSKITSKENVSFLVEGLRLAHKDLSSLCDQVDELPLKHIPSDIITQYY